MTADFARLEEIFTAAVAKADLAEREAYLNKVCAGDAVLRQRLEDLLAADADSATFLPLPKDGTTAVFTPLSERPGSVIGRYKLLEQIGEGGFGVVFMAEQEQPVRRRVALKIIKAGMDTRQVVARFEAERQALAMMDHPNIARVFDAGATETGRPYFVMELVRGVPITEYCDEARLNTNERLALFQSVCSALQHAHQKGIIHRDLKPSNVLVTMHDDKAVPKVIDFGVAKATQGRLTERTLFTEFRAMIGTPNYMSPEQAHMSGLDVDTRSDVYSLGVLLYELLTGTTPIDTKRIEQATYDDLRRLICEVEPPKPSARLSTFSAEQRTTLARQRHCEPRELAVGLRSELDWIVMKCLEKDRARRYESASALAADLQRYLANEPVEACPPSVGYRVSKFIRRNKAAALAAATLALSLTVATALSTFSYLREREARRQMQMGTSIYEIGNAFRNNSQEEAEKSLAAMMPLVGGMDAQNRATLYYRLGDLRARQGLWKESAKYYSLGMKVEPDGNFFEPWHYYLPVLVQSGNLKQYIRERKVLLERFANTADPRIAECALKDCLITPWPDADFDQLQRWSDTALQAKDHWAWNYFLFAGALFEYRRGDYESALEYSRRVVASSSEYPLIVWNRMISAMAHYQAGDENQARRTLENGLEFAHATLRREGLLTSDRLWSDWIVAHALMNEACVLINQGAPPIVPMRLATYRHPAAAIDNLYFLALEKLRSKDVGGYEQACRVLANVPESGFNSVSEFRRIWTLCLSSHALDGLELSRDGAKQAMENNSFETPYLEHLVLGAMLYRTEEYESAAQHLEASIAAYPDRPPFYHGSVEYPQLFLSMVRWRQGQEGEARRLLAKAETTLQAAIVSPATLWDHRATLEILSREAKELIGDSDANSAP